jgi:hypothetical protein
VQVAGDIVGLWVLGREAKLRNSGVVSKVDEGHAAVVAGRVHPAGQGHLIADISLSQFAASVGTLVISYGHYLLLRRCRKKTFGASL